MTKRQQYKVGSIVKVPFESDKHTYARLLNNSIIAFYNAATTHYLSTDEILARPILFRLLVMRYAVTSGRWQKVAQAPLEPDLQEDPIFFRQEIGDPNVLFFYQSGREWSATREDCMKLERIAAWDPEHVEERLSDYYAGRPNRWVEQLRLK